MATYTDLHNRVKENITVDYHSRVTPQEVHLLNQNNIYWGTLSGQVSAENISIKGGTLEGVTLKDIQLTGDIKLPEGVNISRAAADIAQISNDLKTLNENNKEKHDQYDGDISDIKSDIVLHTGKIDCLSGKVDKKLDKESAQQELTTLSTLIVDQIGDLSDDVFDEMSDISNYLSGEIKDLSNDVFKEMSDISTLTFKEMSDISNYLSDEIDTLASNFGGEVQDRIFEDNKIRQQIADEVNKSIERDNAISIALDEYKLENDDNIVKLTKEINEKIEHDKHYSIINQSNGSILTDSYPFACKDFAVNIYNAYIKEGIVEYHDEPNEKIYPIGEIIKISNGYKFKTFSNIECDAILSSIIENHPYYFTTDNGMVTDSGIENGYYRLALDFENKKITLTPTIPSYYPIKYGSDMIGKVYDAYIEGDNIISGRMFITTDDTALSTFKQFNNIPFNTTNLSVSNLYAAERFEYVGNNNLIFTKNISFANYIPIYNANDGYEFARIYDTNNNTDLTSRIAVSLTYLEPDEKIIGILTEDNKYRTILKANQLRGDALFDLTLSATLEDNNATFDVIEVSEMYKYAFTGTNNAGETIEAGYVVPVQYNKTLPEKDFETLSVNIQNAVNIDAFKQTYVLTKADISLWTCEDATSSPDNVLNIKFNGEEVRIKITSKDGNVNAYIYKINVDDKVIFNTEDCHRHIYTSNSTELRYTEIDPSTGVSYSTNISKIPTTDHMEVYELAINQAENDILKICIPERSTNDISREFSIVINPKSASNKLVELQLTDIHGNKVDYISKRRSKLLVPTNMWTTLQVNEINHNKFFIKDFDANENAHDIRVLSTSIDNLSSALSGEIDTLSNKLSVEIIDLSTALSTDLSNEIESRKTAIEELSNQIISNDNDIADIYTRIKGGINYKGVVYGSIKDSSGREVKIQHISNLFVFKQHNFAIKDDYVEDKVLSNGYMYIVNQFEDLSTKKFTIEGKDIEVGDQIIINCKDVDGKAIKDLTINDVDVIDNEDHDTVHYPEFENLSNRLSVEIDSLSASLSIDINSLSDRLSSEIDILSDSISATMKLSVENLQNQIISNDNDIEYLSGQHDWLSANISTDLSNEISSRIKAIQDLSTSLSIDIDNLSDRLSIEISSVSSYATLSIEKLCLEISENDEDISNLSNKVNFLLSVGHDSVEYKGTVPHLENKIDFNLSAFINPLVADTNGFIKRGFLYRLSAAESMLSDCNELTTYLGEKDFFIVNKDTTLDTITFNDIDIFRNAETEVSQLSIELQGQIISNDNDIEYLSSEISSKIFISDKVNNTINDYSDLSIIKMTKDEFDLTISEKSQLDKNTLYVVDSEYIDAYGQVISNLVMSDNKSASEATNKNYVDNINNTLTTKTDKLDKNVSIISVDLISVSNRYSNTFVGKDKSEYTGHISSDNLLITDVAHPHEQYYMSFESGTIVLKPLK